MINQLRLYSVDPARREVFLERFRDHAARIMRDRYNFHILSMWLTDEEQPRFACLFAWPDSAAMRSAWERFRADHEWILIKEGSHDSLGILAQKEEDLALYPVGFSAALTAHEE